MGNTQTATATQLGGWAPSQRGLQLATCNATANTHPLPVRPPLSQVWNTGFPQGKFARARGLELGLAGADRPDLAGYRYHAKRSAEIFDIFTRVWGAEERQARLKYIVGSWAFICK